MKKLCRHRQGGLFFSINMSNIGFFWCKLCGAYRLHERILGSKALKPVEGTRWRYPGVTRKDS